MKNFWNRIWGWFFVDDSELRAAIESFTQSSAEYQKALVEMQIYMEKTEAPLNAKIKDLEKQLEEKKKQVQELLETSKDQSSQADRLLKQIQDKDARINEQSQSIARLNTDKTNLAREKLDYFRRLARIRHEVGIVGQDEPETATAQGGGA